MKTLPSMRTGTSPALGDCQQASTENYDHLMDDGKSFVDRIKAEVSGPTFVRDTVVPIGMSAITLGTILWLSRKKSKSAKESVSNVKRTMHHHKSKHKTTKGSDVAP